MKKIVCLYGGPGSGKSTMAANIFVAAKSKHIDAEMNREYIKEWVWESRKYDIGDQTYLFAKSAKRERHYMRSNVELIINDSPLILNHYYGIANDPYEKQFNTSLHMLTQHHAICRHYGYKVDHYFIKRVVDGTYNENGRFHNEEEAIKIDNELKYMLNSLGIKFTEVNRDDVGLIINKL